ncbi:MAG: hypothetical protein V1926_00330 [Candidatus Peregrinibacteria bacterium]
MARKRMSCAGITNAVLLQHMQAMRSSLEGRIDRMECRMGRLERRMEDGFTDAQGQFKKINDALRRLYAHRVNMLGRIERLEETVGIA